MAFGHRLAENYISFCFSIILIYTIYWIYDIDKPYRGGRRNEMRDWCKENGYDNGENGEFIQLPTTSNYLFGYHPHGPFAIGALIAYSSESLSFSKKFPGIKSYVATLNRHYKVPFYRDFAMTCGAVSVSERSFIYLLDKDSTGISGNLVAVAVGGAREALESRPGKYVLVLSRRRGFFRMAMKTGVHLVPSIGFGETNLYDQVPNPEGSILRKLQEWIVSTFTLSSALFYSTRVIPYRQPITVVVGRPIMCERIPNPTDEEVDKLREKYKQQLVQMFNKYRPLYDPTAEDIRFA
ncbi:hypothetical protein Aperf_G00000091083 [Anoplocephala perfoliata]